MRGIGRSWRMDRAAGLAVLALGAAAGPARADIHYEEWHTPFGHTLACAAAGCSDWSMESAGGWWHGRRETLIMGDAGDATAAIVPSAGCGGGWLGRAYGCMQFTAHGAAALQLDYAERGPPNPPPTYLISKNAGDPFALDVFDYVGSQFVFVAATYVWPTVRTEKVLLPAAGGRPDETLLLFNPLAQTGEAYSQIAGGMVPYAIPDSAWYGGLGFGPSSSIQFTLGHIEGVPEPGAWVMMLGGLFGVGALLRRRRTAAV